MKLWIVAPAAALAILVGLGSSAVAVPSSGSLRVDASIDANPAPAGVESAVTRALTFSVERTTSTPVSGEIVLQYPSDMGSKGGKTEKLRFDLTKVNSAKLTTKLVLPEGVKPGKYPFPVKVSIGGKKYLDMDMLVSKSIDWEYVGPFPGGVDESFDRAFSPEEKFDPRASYEGMNGKKIAWKQFPASAVSPDGMFEFHTLFPDLNNATAYAATTIYSDTEQKVRLLLGSDDALKVWQNGKLVHANKILRGSAPGQDRVDITLSKGANVFLVKVNQADGAWGFHFALDNGNEKPVDGLKYSMIVSRAYLADPVLRLTNVSRTGANIKWESDIPTTSTITVVPAEPSRATPVWGDTPKSAMVKPMPGAKAITIQENSLSSHHTGTITGLQPGTRYLVCVSPAIDGKPSEQLAFYTAPPAGKTMYVKLKVANIIFTNTTTKADSGLPGATVPVSKEDVERMKRDCERASRFYWINTGMRLYIENEYFVTDKYYAVDDKDDPYGVGYQVGDPDEKALEELLTAAGKKVSDYDGRTFISFEKHWDDKTQQWTFPASGGGTIGPEAKPGYGKSAWKSGCTNHWLYNHEFGHEIDALYNWSMGPEYIFNHPQPWDGTAHHHGDHYDCNAWLSREWAGYYTHEHQTWPLLPASTWYRYFINRWGIVEFADDKDEDGIPDNAPKLPLDEVRWKSDPTKKDTDSDGLDDMSEVMACNWVDYGLGEIWSGPVSKHRCDPNNPDTDGDGIRDGVDPYPLYPVNPKLAKGVVSSKPFAHMEDPAYTADLSLAWDDENLYVMIDAPVAPENARVYLDFGDNGIYMGKDNYDLKFKPAGNIRVSPEWHANADKTFAAALHNCGVPNKWPFYDGTGLRDDEVKFEQSNTPKGYHCKIAIPKNLENGVKLVPGQKIGILLSVNPVGGAKRVGDKGDLTIFEPHTLVTFELVK